MGGAPPLPHDFAPQAPKKVVFFPPFARGRGSWGFRGREAPNRREGGGDPGVLVARRPNLAPGVGPFPRCARGRTGSGNRKSGRMRPDRGVPGTLSVSVGGSMYSPACRVRVEDWMPTCGSPRACDIDTPDHEARLGERTPDKPGALATSRVDVATECPNQRW